jgi:hypothetical protein
MGLFANMCAYSDLSNNYLSLITTEMMHGTAQLRNL